MPTNSTVEQVTAICAKHDLRGEISAMPKLGLINDLWRVGLNHLVKIPTHVDYSGSILAEFAASRAIGGKGILAPKTYTIDDERDIVSVPFLIQEFVQGQTLGLMPKAPNWDFARSEWGNVLGQIAEQLARLHHSVTEIPEGQELEPWWADNPEESLEELAQTVRVGIDDANWLQQLFERLKETFETDPTGPPSCEVFVHHDLHPFNILIAEGNPSNLASIIDWGNACWGDPAVDFSGFPLWALPEMVNEYTSHGGKIDSDFEGRVLWFWLGTALREPCFLDEKTFPRHWWRWPEDGVDEFKYRLLGLPKEWSRWAD